MSLEFQEFKKIPRLSRECVITEKIDGTNAQIVIEHNELAPPPGEGPYITGAAGFQIAAGSRNRWITPADDNYGFAKWVVANATELVKLGPGRHYGEWWGKGIQSGYGLQEKRFSLFNTGKWDRVTPHNRSLDHFGVFPVGGNSMDLGQVVKCCDVVPVLFRGPLSTLQAELEIEKLRVGGSVAAPGWMKPEGIVVYHVAGNIYFKKTLEKDSEPKGKTQ